MLDAGDQSQMEAVAPTSRAWLLWRTLCGGLVALVLTALVVVVSMPGPLSRHAPDAALRLDPTNPVALLAKAAVLRERLIETSRNETSENDPDPLPGSAAPATAPVKAQPGARRFAAPKLQPVDDPIFMDRASLKQEIAALATAAIAVDPLNATAHRMLGEVADDPDTVRRAMRTAVALSRRETLALFWLLNDALQRGDLVAVVDYGDMLLRTRIALLPFVASAFAKAAEDTAGRDILVRRLERGPEWRTDILAELPKHVLDPRTPLTILAGLRDAVFPPTQAEIQAYIAAMLERGEPDLAHDAWRALLPRRETTARGQLHNGDFERDLSGYAFDWTIVRGQGASAEIVPQPDTIGQRLLRMTFDGGRVVVPNVRQVVLLKPGRYVFSGRFKGAVASSRGLRWQVRCYYRTRDVLGETDMLLNSQGEWQEFAVAFQAIDIPDCRAQTVSMIHDARTTSEQVMSGEMLFDGLSLRSIE
jgi:hypothetical protein